MKDKRLKPKPFQQWLADDPIRLPRWMLWCEWQCERAAYFLGRWALLETLEHVGKLGLIAGLLVWLWNVPDRREATADLKKSKQYQAWQTISLAYGKPGDLGRTSALNELNRDRLSLVGVDISGATLRGLNLQNAKMSLAVLKQVLLYNCEFSGAQMIGAQFNDAQIQDSRFNDTDLSGARMISAGFIRCSFSNATLKATQFTSTSLDDGNFERADLLGANFAKTTIRGAYFRFANLRGITGWDEILFLQGANFYGVSNAPLGFLEFARTNGAVFTNASYSEWTNVLLPAIKGTAHQAAASKK